MKTKKQTIFIILLSFCIASLIGCGSDRPEITLAVIDQDIDKVKKLIREGADVNDRGPRKNWAPAIEYTQCNFEILKILLKEGADPNLESKSSSVLHEYCTNSKNVEAVELLIKHGANINCIDPLTGGTPVFNSIFNEKKEITKLLINNGADLNIKNKKGLTAIDKLKTKRNEKGVKEMLVFIESIQD